jgi:hypothetical protein
MEVHIVGEAPTKYALFRWKMQSGYFLRLTGVIVTRNSRKELISHPMYKALFYMERHGGQRIISALIGTTEILSVIGRHPYFEVIHHDSE